VQTPISCNDATALFDTADLFNRSKVTTEAVNCLTHATNAGGGDTVTIPLPATTPIEFAAGDDNPLVLAGAISVGADIMVSNSLVTVPVYNSSTSSGPINPLQIIGFVQLFLNPDGVATETAFGQPNRYEIGTTIINMAGCGTGATGQPILGNGASPVAVRLISPP
jgi:hypothetical protein